jgi:hypothetical protein
MLTRMTFTNVPAMFARTCVCLFCFNCVVNLDAALYADNSTTSLLVLRVSFSRDMMTLRLLRRRHPYSKRLLMLQTMIKSKFKDDFDLLQACFYRGRVKSIDVSTKV